MAAQDFSSKYCIIGAGASGITAAKNLKQLGIAYDHFEREDDVGGNWYFGKPNSSVYKSTHLLSSKPLTQYTDFPMPAHYPDYLRQDQVCEYLRSYAKHFDLYPNITFNTSVEKVERTDDGLWDVTLSTGETRRYAGVVIGNGHHWDAKYPDFPGTFNGQTLHTKYYKTPDVLVGKRVLVVGAGNSGCDLAVEAVHYADKVFHSMRRGYYFIPKFVFGKPVDQVAETALKMRVPLPIRRFTNTLLIRAVLGNPQNFGLPKPDHKLLEAHPIVNSQMLYHVAHGDITPKPNVRELCGDQVLFEDGTLEDIDLIIYATGFNISFPFIAPEHLNWGGVGPRLWLHAFHPQYDNLFVVGMLQPDSGLFWLMDMQAQVIARFIRAQTVDPLAAAEFRQMKAGAQPDIRGGVKHLNSARHYLEIAHFPYKQVLLKLRDKVFGRVGAGVEV